MALEKGVTQKGYRRENSFTFVMGDVQNQNALIMNVKIRVLLGNFYNNCPNFDLSERFFHRI